MSRLACRNLCVDIGDRRLIDGLSISARRGEFWGVLGPNGIGKTRLLLTLLGAWPAAGGEVLIHGKALDQWSRRALARHLGLLPQHIQYAFDASCLETALVGRHPHLGAMGREGRRDIELARRALAAMGLAQLANRSCMALSGGESRRLALATLLVQDPEIMLLDEPTNHLDPANQVQVLDHLWRLVQAGRHCLIAALHDVNLATCYCSHVLLLYPDGRWEAGATAELLDSARLSRLYQCPVRLIDDGRQRVFAVAGAPGDGSAMV